MMAAAVLRLLACRLRDGTGGRARLSLARTAAFLTAAGPAIPDEPLAPEDADDFDAEIEATAWGPARRLQPPVVVAGHPMRWARAAHRLGDDAPAWADDPAD